MSARHLLSLAGFASILAIVACSSDDPPANSSSSGTVSSSSGTIISSSSGITSGSTSSGSSSGGLTTPCSSYCDTMVAACKGSNAQYADKADCVSYCESAKWDPGVANAETGNSLACRVYHAGVAAMMQPDVHCPHAGPSGGEVCGSIKFETSGDFVRVDRMGMPAVATALIAAADRNAYNDTPNGSESDASKFIASLTAIHAALDSDLRTKNLVPCSMTTNVNNLPECLGQEYAPGKKVADLVVPYDAIRLDLTAPSGFPNGRQLPDPVIDVTLAVLLLKLGAGTQDATTLAKLPLNPPKNDKDFVATFPYLAPKQ
jgi:Domain of unknown function (DUF4331)